MQLNSQCADLGTRHKLRFSLLVAVVAVTVALALISCKDDDPSAAPTSTAELAATSTQTPAANGAGTTPRPAGSTTPTTGATPGPSGTVSAASLAGRLPALNSYRYAFRLEGTAGLIAELAQLPLPTGVNPTTGTLVFDVKGAYVRPDRGEATINFAGLNVTRVTIGRQQWTGVGGLIQGPVNVSPAEEDYAFIASFWDESPADALRDFTCASGRETINGVSTRKCMADRATIERLNQRGDLFSAGFLDLQSFTRGTAEIWVTDNDKVIRFRVDVAGKDASNRDAALKMEVDIMDINANITINQPR